MLNGYDNLPNYFNNFPSLDAQITETKEFDSTTSFFNRPYHIAGGDKIYFRNTTIGIQKDILRSNGTDISHSFGINIGLADFNLGTIQSYSSTNYLGKDSTPEDGVYHIQESSRRSISAYKKVRRVGLYYENSIRLKPAKWFNLSISLRHFVDLKYKDQLLTRYSERLADTFFTYEKYDDYSIYWMDCIVLGPRLNLYDKEEPRSIHDVSERDVQLNYRNSILFRPEFLFGKQKKVSLYFNVGFSPLQLQGDDFVTNSNWTYGYGLRYRL